MFDLVGLRSFVEVAERGTISGAASALSYSGPAVSQQIAKLERDLGRPVFDRVAGRLRLNGPGARLLPIARELLDLAEVASSSVAIAPAERTVTITGFASALEHIVVPLLADLASIGRRVEIHEAEDEASLRELGLGHSDIAIVQEYDGVPVSRSERFDVTTLLRDRLRLIAPPDRRRTITMERLRDANWLTNGSGTRCEEAMARILSDHGIVPALSGRVADNQTLLALVRAGHGATIVPELVLTGGREGLTVASQDLGVSRTVLAATRASQTFEHRDVLGLLAQASVG